MRIRLGMVGGGEGAFIGAVHRIAARMDDRYTLVAGALSSNPGRARASAEAVGIAADRAYDDFRVMAQEEAAREDGIEAVAIVTPNHLHAPVAEAFLNAGIHVICDKPLTTSLAEGERLKAVVDRSGKIFALTHNYSGFPLVRQARQMVADGEIGAVRVVVVEYAQDWLAEPLEETGHKQAGWRTDPAQSGPGGSIGDIGTHAYQLACFVTGLDLRVTASELSTFVPGRRVDDNAFIRLAAGEARGSLWASQVATGAENALWLRVFGERGALSWHQERPNDLWYTPLGAEPRLITRAGAGARDVAARVTRIPAGHIEGYLEGFANIYTEVAQDIIARREGRTADPAVMYPTIEDGLAGMRFIEDAIRLNGA
ncbi:MAG: Gfo/Idh/MocA family oxidoreductase [Pseudomonadota bacterium]